MAIIYHTNPMPHRLGGSGKTPVVLAHSQPFTPDYAPEPGRGIAAMSNAQQAADRMEAQRVINGAPAFLHSSGVRPTTRGG